MARFDREVWEGKKPLTPPPATSELVADLNLVEVGWSAWSSSLFDDRGRRRGGVICGVNRSEDPSTGEIGYRFRTRWAGRNPHGQLILDGADIALPDGIDPPIRQRTWLLIRSICGALAPKGDGLGAGRTLTAIEAAALEDAFTLYLSVR